MEPINPIENILPTLRGKLTAVLGVKPYLRLIEAGEHFSDLTVHTIDLNEAEPAGAGLPLFSGAVLLDLPGVGKILAATDKEAFAGSGKPQNDRKIVWQRLENTVAIVTGSAQGFGEGIAFELAKVGATVVIADLNEALAKEVASKLNETYGPATALAVGVDVSDEESVRHLVDTTVCAFGGLDVYISNAGVLRAGSLEEMDLKSFEFVTKINYTAFFLAAKYAARPMRLQNREIDGAWTDIIQINSKSGLEGSNKNFAYAGGKFGGIGLTQSFAKELVSDRIKVNAVCPGNFYEGPLWSDPKTGLFVQYLATGKVPGAKTIDDVYRDYVAKVPMQKGCSPADVARAVFYLIEQINETGQALPVTGGQVMLH